MRQVLSKTSRVRHLQQQVLKQSSIISETRRHASTQKDIDFTQSPSDFLKSLDALNESKTTTQTTPTTQQLTDKITSNQRLHQILSLNAQLHTRNATLLTQVKQLLQEAQNEPEQQEKAMERFRRITSSDPSTISEEERKNPVQGITTRKQLLQRFEAIQSLFEHVTETTSQEGFHKASAQLLQLDSPLFPLLEDTKYHNYPPIYTIDVYLTRIINALQLGDFARAEQSCSELLARVKTLSAQIDKALTAKRRREALETAEFRSSGKYGNVSIDVESDLELLRKRYYTTPSKWNVYGISYPDFDPIIGIEENNDVITENINAYATQAHISLMETYILSNQIDKAEQYLLTRMEDPTLENTFTNALDIGTMGTVRACQGRFDEAVTYYSRAIKQLLLFPKTSVLRTLYELLLLQSEQALGKRNIGDDILSLRDRLASEESAELKQYIRGLIADTLLSRNNSKAHSYIDAMIQARGIPSKSKSSFDLPQILRRRADALTIDLDVNDKEAVDRIRQIYNQAIEISIQQTGDNGYTLPLIYDSYANFNKIIGDNQTATAVASKRDAVNQQNNTTVEQLKVQQKFLTSLIGLYLPREQFSLVPREAESRKPGIDNLQQLNQMRDNIQV
jgi:hypothetical protein